MRAAAIFLASICLAPALCAQQTPTIDLKGLSRVDVLGVRRSQIAGTGACDGEGNVYVRLWSGMPRKQGVAANAVWKISATGELVASFRALDAFHSEMMEQDEELVGKGVFVTADERVFQPVTVHGETFIVEFTKDGSLKSKTKLISNDLEDALIYRLAVFKSGEFLLTAATGKDHLVPFTGVFTSDGTLLRKINEPEDEEARQNTSPVQFGSSRALDDIAGADFLWRGDVALASDGNVYLMHGTRSPALIYAISPSGDVIRKMRIDAGDPKLMARSIKYDASRLAVQFDREVAIGSRHSLVKIVDLHGRPVATYRVDPTSAGGRSLFLAGYRSGSLTFVPLYSENKLYLVKADLP